MTNNLPEARAIAMNILEEIMEKDGYCHIVLKRTLTKYQDLKKQDRALITRIVEGTLEHQMTIDYIINSYSKTKVKKMKPVIRTVLRMSVYQMKYMTQIPDSAICNEAVKLVKKRGLTGLSGFVNGILRTMIREPGKVSFPDPKKDKKAYLSITYSMPEWIIEVLHSQYDWDTVEATLKAFVESKETSIRCNTNFVTPDQLEEVLKKEGVTVTQNPNLPEAFKISGYNYLGDLESFQKGYFQVQDLASMLVAKVAGIKKDDFIIDVCAAPGGKSLHAACILQDLGSTMEVQAKKGYVISRDLTEYKVGLITENKVRLKQENLISEVHDALVLDQDNIGKADVVIADLPCSGLGVIGKKPDIKYKIKPESLEELAKLQRQILDVVTQYVKPNGTLIYSTCTMNHEENEGNMNYLVEHLGFTLEGLEEHLPIAFHNEDTKRGYLRLLPGVHGSDGFFITRLVKKG